MSRLKSGWKKFMTLNGASVFVAMIVIIILFEIIMQLTKHPDGLVFATVGNLTGILRQQSYIGIIAFGLTLVMITGNIDLSIGSLLTMLCCVSAKIMMTTDNGFLGFFGTIAVGALCGLLNGVLVSYVKLNSFITTLGTSSIFTAFALKISAGTILVIPDNCSPFFKLMGTSSLGPIHILIIWLAVVAIVLGFILSRTVYGQQLYAIGSNPIAARFSGIKAKRNICLSYVITGLCTGLAAAVMMANALSSNPQNAQGKEMEIILCVVLGGVSVTGGKGSVWGTIIGIMFYGVLSAGFTQLNLSIYIQWVIMGAIMVAALSMDVLKERGVKLWKKR